MGRCHKETDRDAARGDTGWRVAGWGSWTGKLEREKLGNVGGGRWMGRLEGSLGLIDSCQSCGDKEG